MKIKLLIFASLTFAFAVHAMRSCRTQPIRKSPRSAIGSPSLR